MLYLKNYKDETEYIADVNKYKPNVSVYMKDNKPVIKYIPFNINGRIAKAGDIVLVRTSNPSIKIFVPYKTYDTMNYNDYTPIGVVVVPFSHTLDNTVRIMSLKNMSLTDPENGSVATGGSYDTNSFYWGGYGNDISTLTNFTKVPNIDKTEQSIGTIGSKDWVRIPSNYVEGSTFSGGVESILDIGTKYYVSTEDDRFGVSPYDSNGNRSTEAFSVISPTTNAMCDLDGYSNTAKILAVDNELSTDWQTASTIENNSGSTNVHAPAQCCWRYNTIGIDAHNWYLPAEGELAYLIARYADINEALTNLMSIDSTKAIRLWRNDPTVKDTSTVSFGYWLWSSTEYNSSYARYVDVYLGDLSLNTKRYSSTNNRVRAFAALSV